MESPEPKIDKRIENSRAALRSAALKLASDTPASKVTVASLCREAKVNRGTFYNHYETIEGVIEECEQLFFEEFEAHLKAIGDADQDFASLCYNLGKPFPPVTELFESLLANREFLYYCTRPHTGNRYFGLLTEHMTSLFDEEIIKKDEYTFEDESFRQFYICYQSSAHVGIIMRWAREGFVEPPEYMARIAMYLFFIEDGARVSF